MDPVSSDYEEMSGKPLVRCARKSQVKRTISYALDRTIFCFFFMNQDKQRLNVSKDKWCQQCWDSILKILNKKLPTQQNGSKFEPFV
jgi:hypothetical protein